MAKQWATRVIVAFQSACWCIAILLMLSRGVSNIRASYGVQGRSETEAKTSNATTAQTDPGGRGFTLGVTLITVAALMIVASPAIIVARAYDRRRYRSVERFPDLGLPPRYEDIVSRAPSYSTLFDAEDGHQLQEMASTATVI